MGSVSSISAIEKGRAAMSQSSTPGITKIAGCIVAVFAILFVVPFIVYSIFALIAGTEPPEDAAPALFFASVVIEKVGHAFAFVLIFYLGRSVFSTRWLQYALIWWIMFALGELALALRQPTYTADMALGGVIAEAIYLPLSAWVTQKMLGTPTSRATD